MYNLAWVAGARAEGRGRRGVGGWGVGGGAWGEGRGERGKGGIQNCHRMSKNVRKRQKISKNSNNVKNV